MKCAAYVKIVATLGPATASKEKIEELTNAGVDLFRLNFSHGSHENHLKTIEKIRSLENKLKKPIGILADMQGPKLRVGEFKDGKINLEKGQKFTLDMINELGDEKRVCLPHPEIFEFLKNEDELLLDDGKLKLKVNSINNNVAETTVVVGGKLSDHKGLNVPGTILSISALTEKDHRDLKFALEHDVDFIGLSFVQRPEDVKEAKNIIDGRAKIIAKLEKPSAIESLDEIVELSDAIMVARGDLGVEMPAECVPIIQKKIVSCCRSKGKPVIVATQMLKSMINTPTPTRAEASDVATAVFDGADAVMLSGETAVGEYPIEAVSMMDKIICRTESDEYYLKVMEANRVKAEKNTPDAISAAARMTAETIDASAIVTFTVSGSTTYRVARERPQVPIISLTPNAKVARQNTLIWGTTAVIAKQAESFTEVADNATEQCLKLGVSNKDDLIVITAGVPFSTKGKTNILRVAKV